MTEPYAIITTRAVRDRYAAFLAEQSRQRHEAAYEWTRLHWWQWRKRRRLHRVLFGIGGWRSVGLEDTDLPERVVLPHIYRRGLRVEFRRGFTR